VTDEPGGNDAVAMQLARRGPVNGAIARRYLHHL
jgi:hypothetical protein